MDKVSDFGGREIQGVLMNFDSSCSGCVLMLTPRNLKSGTSSSIVVARIITAECVLSLSHLVIT